jgi:hypothetical protein
MNPRIPLAALAIGALLAACGGGPPRRMHPSTASIQQLAVEADGSWRVTLRLQNFSTFPMRYSMVEAKLSIDGKEAGTLSATTDLEILANSGDVVVARLQGSQAQPPDRDFAYVMNGTIRTSEPSQAFDFERSSRLSPVPGVANTWR